MPRSTIDPVGSNARWGSDVLRVNELSITSVELAAWCAPAASAAAAHARPTTAASGNVNRHLLKGVRLNATPLSGDLPPYWTREVPPRFATSRRSCVVR